MLKAFLTLLLFTLPLKLMAGDYQTKTQTGVKELITWFAATLVVLALIFVLSYFFKKLNLNKSVNSKLKVVSSIYVGSKQRVVIVQVGLKQILLGVSPNSINYLCEVEDTKTQFEQILAKSGTDKTDDIKKSNQQ